MVCTTVTTLYTNQLCNLCLQLFVDTRSVFIRHMELQKKTRDLQSSHYLDKVEDKNGADCHNGKSTILLAYVFTSQCPKNMCNGWTKPVIFCLPLHGECIHNLSPWFPVGIINTFILCMIVTGIYIYYL